MKRILAAVAGCLVLGGVTYAAQPHGNHISAAKHPNLAAAQRALIEAYDKIGMAQKANEFDLKGHAAKAKVLLEEANTELKLAAEASNEK